jgi:hypothetical protein
MDQAAEVTWKLNGLVHHIGEIFVFIFLVHDARHGYFKGLGHSLMLPICPYYKNGDEEMRFAEVAFSEQRSSPSK